MDVEQIAEELYALKPTEFVASRDAYVAEARKVKDSAAAKAVAALRRPALAAWAANLLARQRPEEAAQFLALGETLRVAHRTLDAEQLRTASRRKSQLITALAHNAAALAQEAGQPVSDTVLREIEQSLHGVLADPDVAEEWSKGRLVKVPEAAVDFAVVAPEAAPSRPAPDERRAPNTKSGRGTERLRDLERARTAAEEANGEVARCEQELGEARDVQGRVAAKAEEAAERVRSLEHELQAARQAVTETGAAVAEARGAVRAAERALEEARGVAERATRAVERLEEQGEP
ncbi:hypothetical protein ACWFR1_30195 [Streptomyces sp. NPDC055103]